MAFAGHARSIDLSHAPLRDTIGNSNHPDRTRNITLDRASYRGSSETAKRSNRTATQQDVNRGACEYNHIANHRSGTTFAQDTTLARPDDKGNPPGTSLWIGNTPHGLTDDKLRHHFASFGPVLSVRVIGPQRCGFVNFAEVESAIYAWQECHEKDIFGTGEEVYVRYQQPPEKIKDRNKSLKRKLSIAPAAGVFLIHSSKADSLTQRPSAAPKVPPTGPRAHRQSISPPPSRRHDIYRPSIHSEQVGSVNHLSDNRRESDCYRPIYEEDIGGKVSNQSITPAPEVSQNLTASRSHRVRPDDAAPLVGIGIKGLATAHRGNADVVSRLTPSSSGISIKGAAASIRSATTCPPARESSTELHPVRKSLPMIESLQANTHMKRKSMPAGVPSNRVSSRLCDDSAPTLIVNDSLVDHVQAPNIPMITRSSIGGTRPPTPSNDCDSANKAIPEQCLLSEMSGLKHLTYLYDFKEKVDLAARKARTISPFDRFGNSSRAASVASVASARTDPTPLQKAGSVDRDVCEKCKVAGGTFLKIIDCATPACKKKIHFGCGNTMESNNDQAEKILCDICFRANQYGRTLCKASKSRTCPDAVSQKLKEMDQRHDNTLTPIHPTFALPSFSKGELGIMQTHRDTICTTKYGLPGRATSTRTKESKATSEVGTYHEFDAEGLLVQGSGTDRVASHAQSSWNPPSGPRSDRIRESIRPDKDVSVEAAETVHLYKSKVTCPWWRGKQGCYRHEDDCMFAHSVTGTETPDGYSKAKAWTCHKWYATATCGYAEKDCLYSHRDTGLYVGLDGKASKKHLECYWWYSQGRCNHPESLCTCAHHFTGFTAEAPPPRDTIRRISSNVVMQVARDVDSESTQLRSPSYSPPPPMALDTPESIESPTLVGVKQTNAPHTDPRLTRSTCSKPRTERPADSTLRANTEQATVNDSNGSEPARTTNQDGRIALSAPPKSRRPTMSPCKICSKLIFKAEICTDCLKLTRKQDTLTLNDTDVAADMELEVSVSENTMIKASTSEIPGAKVLKRSRADSTSHLFASKRMRPDMSATRVPASNIAPPSLEELNRMSLENKAKEACYVSPITTQNSFTPDASLDREYFVSRSEIYAKTPAHNSPTSAVISNTETGYRRMLPESIISDPPRHDIDVQEQHDATKMPLRKHAVLVPTNSRSTTPASDCDSEKPLAEVCNRNEKPFWSPDTADQSPQQARKTSTMTPSHAKAAPNGQHPPTNMAVRCRKCIIQHRRCVHDLNGRFDPQKCFDWQQDRIRSGGRDKPHYSQADRAEIQTLADEFASAKHATPLSAESVTESNDLGNEDDVTMSSYDEDEDDVASSEEPIISYGQGRRKALWDASRLVEAEPSSISALKNSESSRTRLQVDVSNVAPNLKLNTRAHILEKDEDVELDGIIARLKSRGAIFEDSDTDEEMNETDLDVVDARTYPLRHHKRGEPVQEPRIPIMTKGGGLKFPQLVRRRRMLRNVQLFGNCHKEVDRQIKRQVISARIEKRDHTDVSAPPQVSEEEMTISEFLGLPDGREMEPTLGKITLPRGSCTMGLAFREKDMGTQLSALGRVRRANKKERPLFLVGL